MKRVLGRFCWATVLLGAAGLTDADGRLDVARHPIRDLFTRRVKQELVVVLFSRSA